MSRAITTMQWLVLLLVGASPLWVWILHVSAEYPLCNKRIIVEESKMRCHLALPEGSFCQGREQAECEPSLGADEDHPGFWEWFTACSAPDYSPLDDCLTKGEECTYKHVCVWRSGKCRAGGVLLDPEGEPMVVSAPRVQPDRHCTPNPN